MRIVKRVYFGGIISDIKPSGMPFEYTQKMLTKIDPLIIGDFIYWVVTIEYPEE